MPSPSPTVGDQLALERRDLDQLMRVLSTDGYRVIGPTVREGGIVYEDLTSTADLPVGWKDEQGAGIYRLIQRGDSAFFGYNAGPQSWKKFLHPAALRMWRARGEGEGGNKSFEMTEDQPKAERFAFIGVRPCDLHAISVLDRVFTKDRIVEAGYKARREGLFIVAVNCTQAGKNCFCASMGTGPRADSGFDLALTEILQGDTCSYLVEVGSEAGASILAQVGHVEASEDAKSLAEKAIEAAARGMGHSLDTTGLKETLYRSYDSPHWGEVAKRCLACSNCTLVCPTCFCTTIEDITDLTGENAERWRKWDSCFTLDFSYIHGGSIRSSISSRYRQWLLHKLGTWVDQFGTFGCVGCGRCIAWCPVGIDITQEARAIQSAERK
jgi:ferredoxin